MVRAQLPLSLVMLLVPLVARGITADAVSVRAQRIEHGLLPAIAIEGAPAQSSTLSQRMTFYKVPAVSIAVIDQGAIAWARGYGVTEAGTQTPVTTETLFQAASISKAIASVVALRLVEQGALELDGDVNSKLRSWKLPESELTSKHKVSLRLLLSHRGGLTDHAGFREADPNQALPSLREILETGRWTPASIRVGFEPGSRFVYSGGGYCLMEQLLEDVSGKPFPVLARQLVLEPLAMRSSSFDQNLSPEQRFRVAVGHQRNGQKLPQHWNLYPATSAAGLWTTPTDLARFAIQLQQVKQSGRSSVLEQESIDEMLSIQGPENDRDSKVISVREAIADQPPPAWGLGVGLVGRPPFRFFHSGSNPGYQCELHAYVHNGQGAVIMTNGDQGWRLIREILWAVAREYDWREYDYRPEIKKPADLSQVELERFVGQYQILNSPSAPQALSVTRADSRLWAQIADGARAVRLYAQSSDTCFTVEDAMTLKFTPDESGNFSDVASDLGWRAKRH